MLKRIDGDLYDWVEYHTRMLEGSCLGYASISTLGRIMEDGGVTSDNFSSKVPFLRNAPPHVKDIDQVLHHLPDQLLEFIKAHYVERSTHKTRAVYHKLDMLHHEILGGLYMLR